MHTSNSVESAVAVNNDNTGRKRPYKAILNVSISLAILSFIFWTVPLKAVVGSFQNADILFIAFSLALSPFVLFLNAAHTKVLTDKQGMALSVWKIIKINLISIFYGLFLPGMVSSGLIKWYKLAKSEQKRTEAFLVIVFNRFYDTVVLSVIGVLMWVLDPLARQNALLLMSMMALCFALFVAGLISHSANTIEYLYSQFRRLPVKIDFAQRITSKIVASVRQFHSLTTAELLKITGMIAIKHLIGITTFLLFAIAVQIDLPFASHGWIRTYIMLAMMLPISLAGLGVREGGMIVLLQLYGIPPQQALAFSFLLLGRSILLGLVGGIVESRLIFSKNQMG